MAQFTVTVLAIAAALVGVVALVLVWQVLAADRRQSPNDSDPTNRS